MRLPLLLILPLLAACGDHDHDHGPADAGHHGHDHSGHSHDHPGVPVTLLAEGDAAKLWGNLNALAASLGQNAATLASDAVNLAALAEALEPLAANAPDSDRAAGMLANLARAADQLAHAADEGEPVEEPLARVRQVLELARRLDPASAAAPVEPTYVAGPSGGVLAQLRDASGNPAGWAEVKLHGDAGDLELWLARDIRITDPLGVPVAASAKLELAGPSRIVELRARDAAANKDERGRVTVADGRTHYLVYPGETGADASWLVGEGFRSRAKLSVEGLTAEFDLTPH
jgi:hypothetical protein